MAKQCSNCSEDAVWESVSSTASAVAFCGRHEPYNVVASRNYQRIDAEEWSEVPPHPDEVSEDLTASAMPVMAASAEPEQEQGEPSEEEAKPVAKKKTSKKKSSAASSASKKASAPKDTGDDADGGSEALSES